MSRTGTGSDSGAYWPRTPTTSAMVAGALRPDRGGRCPVGVAMEEGDSKVGGRRGSKMGVRMAGMPFKTIISLSVPTASFTL